GTSMVAASLKWLGVSSGHNLMGPAPDNPRGFFEDIDFLNLNEAVLRATFSRWDSLEIRPLNRSAEALREPAAKLLRSRLERWPLFGLKDPRFCRLLPFWRPVFEEVGCEVSCVYAMRHPDAVAQSLAKRNGFTREKGLYLWLRYVVASFIDA